MDIAPATPEPGRTAVTRDRERMRYASIGALALLAGIWLSWMGNWLLGWSIEDLGVVPRTAHGLIGILTAPMAHGSFDHLMSNSLPLAMLATLTLYAYPRAARLALPIIWIGSGIGVWLFARASVHVGASGITHGLMFFLFVIGLIRRDRVGVAIALVVFFFYGSMLLTVLPREEHISFEYHLAGAVMGVLAAILFARRDPEPVRKRYSWEDEDEYSPIDEELDMPRPDDVPVLWSGPSREEDEPRVLAFQRRQPMPPAEPD